MLCVFLMFGCSKNNDQNKLIGTWELTQSYGGWTGIVNYAPGNGNTVSFNNDGQFIQTIVSADTSYKLVYNYKIVKPNECNENLEVTSSIGDPAYLSQFSISRDSLFLSTGACIVDGGTSVYLRK